MRSNYKKLGKYIQQINKRNTDLNIDRLLGVSINKVLMPSIANTVGTNMKTYKIIKKNQFAYGPVTSRNGDKISIALLQEYDEAILSQAYTVFEVIDETELHPEYLMMWFRRPEFDRYARFKSHGSARETFDWDEMCEVELPIPSIEKQREIVKEFNTVVNRIKLNEQLNQKLEETAQALYKHWFVDFEFPNENGEPYKSSGGAMVYNEELDKEIPEGWEECRLEKEMNFSNGKKKPKNTGTIPIYGGNGVLGYAEENNYEDVIAIGRVGAYCGSLYRVVDKCWVSDNAIAGFSKKNNQMYCFELLKSLDLNSRSEGTGQPLLTQGILNNIVICSVPEDFQNKFNTKANFLFGHTQILVQELERLRELESTILSKMTKIENETIKEHM